MKDVNWIINHRRITKEMNYAAADLTMQRYAFSEQRGLNYCLSNKPPIPDNGGLHKKIWHLKPKESKMSESGPVLGSVDIHSLTQYVSFDDILEYNTL